GRLPRVLAGAGCNAGGATTRADGHADPGDVLRRARLVAEQNAEEPAHEPRLYSAKARRSAMWGAKISVLPANRRLLGALTASWYPGAYETSSVTRAREAGHKSLVPRDPLDRQVRRGR